MTVLPLLHSDLPAVKELQPPDWSDIIPSIEFYLRAPFCHPVKIAEGGRLLGIGATYHHGDTAWLAHIIVHPSARNRGVGLAITKALVDSAKSVDTIYLVATSMGEPVYLKAGFTTECEYIFYSRTGHSHPFPPSENIRSYDDRYRRDMLGLDRVICGENREAAMNEHLPHAMVYSEGNRIDGAYLPSWGDGLIIARTVKAGIALMQERLKKHDKAVLPAANIAGIQFLEANGFTEEKRAKRMRLGRERAWQPQNIYNRIAGKLG